MCTIVSYYHCLSVPFLEGFTVNQCICVELDILTSFEIHFCFNVLVLTPKFLQSASAAPSSVLPAVSSLIFSKSIRFIFLMRVLYSGLKLYFGSFPQGHCETVL